MTTEQLLKFPLHLKWVNSDRVKYTEFITLNDIIKYKRKKQIYFFTDGDDRIIHFWAVKDQVLFMEYQNLDKLTQLQFDCLRKAFYGDDTLINPDCSSCK